MVCQWNMLGGGGGVSHCYIPNKLRRGNNYSFEENVLNHTNSKYQRPMNYLGYKWKLFERK